MFEKRVQEPTEKAVTRENWLGYRVLSFMMIHWHFHGSNLKVKTVYANSLFESESEREINTSLTSALLSA